MPWYVYALTASLIWGIHYNLIVKVSNYLESSPLTAFIIYLLPNCFAIILLIIFFPAVQSHFTLLLKSPTDIKISAVILIFTSLAGTMAMYMSLALAKHSTHAAMIEITYPLALAIFALFILNENHFNLSTILGGGFILIGASVILYNS